VAERAAALRREIERAGHLLVDRADLASGWARLWAPLVTVRIVAPDDAAGALAAGPGDAPPSALRVLVVAGAPPDAAARSAGDRFDVCVASEGPVPRSTGASRRWWTAPDERLLFSALDVRTRSHHFELVEREIFEAPPAACEVSAIVCTWR